MYKGKTKVIHTCLNFPEHILSYILCQCYMRFLILLFSFIFRHWIFSAISQCRFWEQSQGKSRDATNGRNHCQKYLQKGFSWVIYHNYWKCHCQKYLNKYSLIWKLRVENAFFVLYIIYFLEIYWLIIGPQHCSIWVNLFPQPWWDLRIYDLK